MRWKTLEQLLCQPIITAAVVITGTIACADNFVLAQISPDATLGTESSVVTPSLVIQGLPSSRIDSGAIRGTNLFHSFEEFNIDSGRGVYFNNPAEIQNIFSRVTGSKPSHILGKLGVLGNASLFLLNPNGIIFGPSASLDLQGSFLATTGNSINFADGTKFSATASQSAPLLTVSVPIGLGFGGANGRILVQGNGQPVDVDTTTLLPKNAAQVSASVAAWQKVLATPINQPAGLQVQPGKTLALIGGDVVLDGGSLTAPRGQIELGSVAGLDSSIAPVEVNINTTAQGWNLSYGGINNFQDIQLLRQSLINASGEAAGFIQAQGRNINITNQSRVIATTEGNQNGAGIFIQAEHLNIGDHSLLGTATVNSGKGGNLTIQTNSLTLEDKALLGTLTLGQGAAGNLNLRSANAVTLSNDSIIATSPIGAAGSGGNLTIETNQLIINGGSRVSTSTFGAGHGGNLTVQAHDFVQVMGESAIDQYESNLSARTFVAGNAGNLTINTQNLIAKDGGQVSVSTISSSGNGGTLVVNASESIEAVGVVSDRAGLFAGVSSGATGRGGSITINTQKLSVRDGAGVSTSVSATGIGQGGSLTVNAELVEVIGHAVDDNSLESNISARTRGAGDGGSLTIHTGTLFISNGGNVSVSTFGTGNAGSLLVNASESIEAVGIAGDRSGLFARSNQGATGRGGNLTIYSGNLIVRDGASVSASTASSKPGGNLTINADAVELSGFGFLPSGERRTSNLSALSSGTGDAGNLTINTRDLNIRNQATVAASSDFSGNGGNLNIVANSIFLDNQATITAATASGNGGNMDLKANSLQMRHQSQISATAGGNGNGGNIKLNPNTLIALENSDISAKAFIGRGGAITINTSGIFRSADSDITASSAVGVNGVVEIRTFGLDFKNSLLPVTANFINPDQVIADSCLERRNVKQGSFTVTGTGGLPRTPYDAISDRYPLAQVQALAATSNHSTYGVTVAETPSWKAGYPIVEAQRIVHTADGRILLAVSPSEAIALTKDVVCHTPQEETVR